MLERTLTVIGGGLAGCEAAWQAAVPVLGQLMALQRVLRGDGLSAHDAFVPAAVALVLALAAVAAVARLLRDERIVFGRS